MGHHEGLSLSEGVGFQTLGLKAGFLCVLSYRSVCECSGADLPAGGAVCAFHIFALKYLDEEKRLGKCLCKNDAFSVDGSSWWVRYHWLARKQRRLSDDATRFRFLGDWKKSKDDNHLVLGYTSAERRRRKQMILDGEGEKILFFKKKMVQKTV